MLQPRTRRAFLGDVGKGMLIATVGSVLAADLGLAKTPEGAAAAPETLDFGDMEALVASLQDTPINKLNAFVVERIRGGTPLKTLVAAAALANARTFGGED